MLGHVNNDGEMVGGSPYKTYGGYSDRDFINGCLLICVLLVASTACLVGSIIYFAGVA